MNKTQLNCEMEQEMKKYTDATKEVWSGLLLAIIGGSLLLLRFSPVYPIACLIGGIGLTYYGIQTRTETLKTMEAIKEQISLSEAENQN